MLSRREGPSQSHRAVNHGSQSAMTKSNNPSPPTLIVWQKGWESESTFKVARSFLPEVDRKRLNQMKRESVLNLQLMMAIITNHGFFGAHLNKLNKNYDPICGLCDREKETSYHIYAECSETVQFRSREQKTPGEILRTTDQTRRRRIPGIYLGGEPRSSRRRRLVAWHWTASYHLPARNY